MQQMRGPMRGLCLRCLVQHSPLGVATNEPDSDHAGNHQQQDRHAVVGVADAAGGDLGQGADQHDHAQTPELTKLISLVQYQPGRDTDDQHDHHRPASGVARRKRDETGQDDGRRIITVR